LNDLDIGNLTDEFNRSLGKVSNLQDLTMNGCKIGTLKGFPTNLPIARLELNDNSITGAELVHLQGLKVRAANRRTSRRCPSSTIKYLNTPIWSR
jgi:hypothetical protein